MRTCTFILCLLLAPLAALAQPRKIDVPHSEQTIGSWLVSCATDPMTDEQNCRMRHRLWIVVPTDSHPGLALEVQQRADQLVPVLAVRDISLTTAMNGLLTLTATAQVRFDNNAVIELPCALEGTAIICAPTRSDAATSAGQLAKAQTVLVRLRAVANLPLPMADEPVALDFDKTQEALMRYRLAGPAIEVSQQGFGQDLKGMVDRLMRRIGVPGSEPPAPPAQPK